MKVSVILPAYNAASTINMMMDSMLCQTFKDFEILAIDDGSTDDTGKILDAYAQQDSRVRVFHKPNGGVAMARQLGVDNAQGEYSIHVDADDWVEPTMLEEMYAKAKAEDADVVIVDFYSDRNGMREVVVQNSPLLTPVEVLHDIFRGVQFGSLCNKMLRTNLYERYGARFFPDINYCEDVLIWVQLLKNEEVKIAYMPKAYYHYVYQQNSITHKISRKQYDNLLRYENKLNELLPGLRYKEIRERLRFGLLKGGIYCHHLSSKEIYSQIWHSKVSILRYNRSGTWFLCFFLLVIGMHDLAFKILQKRSVNG